MYFPSFELYEHSDKPFSGFCLEPSFSVNDNIYLKSLVKSKDYVEINKRPYKRFFMTWL